MESQFYPKETVALERVHTTLQKTRTNGCGCGWQDTKCFIQNTMFRVCSQVYWREGLMIAKPKHRTNS